MTRYIVMYEKEAIIIDGSWYINKQTSKQRMNERSNNQNKEKKKQAAASRRIM